MGEWLSEHERCDICDGRLLPHIVEFFVDGKTTAGPWALMCPGCFEKHGVGIGPSLGQKYDPATLQCIEGAMDDDDTTL